MKKVKLPVHPEPDRNMKLHVVLPPASDSKFIGDEPTWDGKTVSDDTYIKEMMRGLNWHNYVASETDFRKYYDQWASVHYPSYVGIMKDVAPTKLNCTIAAVCRMHLQGFPLRQHHIDQILGEFVAKLVPKAKASRKKVVDTPVAKVDSVQDKMKKQITGTLADIDYEIDQAFENFMVDATKLEDAILRKGFRGPQLRLVTAYVQKQIAEWNLAYSGEDEALAAGYKYVGKRNFKRIIDGFTSVLEKISGHVKTISTRKPRKKKPLDRRKLVKALVFIPQLDKIDGAQAVDIIGASCIWVYDTKTRKIGYLKGEKKGLSVKGKTITGVVEAKLKMLRWPSDQLPEFSKTRGKSAFAWLDGLTTKYAEQSPRMTHTMILLRVEV